MKQVSICPPNIVDTKPEPQIADISTQHTHTDTHTHAQHIHRQVQMRFAKPARLSNLICANQLTKQMIRLSAHSHRWYASVPPRLFPLPVSLSPLYSPCIPDSFVFALFAPS